MSATLHVEFESGAESRRVDVESVDNTKPLSELLAESGIYLNTRCSGKGLCGGCVVKLLAGELYNIRNRYVAKAGPGPLAVEGCLFALADGGEVRVLVPERSSLAGKATVVSDFSIPSPDHLSPLYVNHSYLEGQGGSLPLGAAIDIGTTTVAALLVDLNTGEILAKASSLNRQARFGDDVISRIKLCSEKDGMVKQLQAAIVQETLVPILKQALSQIDEKFKDIHCYCVAGNTTMLHLLAGVDPTPMGAIPFRPDFLDHRVLAPEDIGLLSRDKDCHLSLNNERVKPQVHLLPGISAFVGADLSAGALVTEILKGRRGSILLDIGTNGEMILVHGGKAYACATAAGPAFEGVGLFSGSRAVEGAVCSVKLEGPGPTPVLRLIGGGGGNPIGICGSAYIDFLAEGKRRGVLNACGRFDKDNIRDLALLQEDENYSLLFKLADSPQSGPVGVSEKDLSGLLQAKGAIAAGIEIMLKNAGIKAADIETLHLAGGFGMNIDIPNAIECGLFPGFKPEQVKAVGNTSLAGAYLTLLDGAALGEMSAYIDQIQVVELNLDPDFENFYIDHMML